MSIHNDKAAKVLDKISSFSKKLTVQGKYIEEVDGNKDFEETYYLPFGYLVRNSWFNKNQFQPKRYVSIAAETALSLGDYKTRTPEETVTLNNFYRDVFWNSNLNRMTVT